MRVGLLSIALLAVSLWPQAGHCQWRELPSTGSPQNQLPDRTTLTGQSGMGALLTAELLDEESNAKQHKAVIKVNTDGVRMVNAAADHSPPKLDEAHLQYQLDDQPVQNTTSKTWSFENLSRGEHIIHVKLVGNDNKPLAKTATLRVKIP